MTEEPDQLSTDPELTAGEMVEEEPSFFADPRRLLQTLVAVVLLMVAIYVLFPKVVGLEDALGKIGRRRPPLDRDRDRASTSAPSPPTSRSSEASSARRSSTSTGRESYQITMAGLAATRLFSAGGAGGILLTYWALRKAGMERRRSVCRMVAFLVLLYSVYLVALVVFGVLLRTGVLPGDASGERHHRARGPGRGGDRRRCC